MSSRYFAYLISTGLIEAVSLPNYTILIVTSGGIFDILQSLEPLKLVAAFSSSLLCVPFCFISLGSCWSKCLSSCTCLFLIYCLTALSLNVSAGLVVFHAVCLNVECASIYPLGMNSYFRFMYNGIWMMLKRDDDQSFLPGHSFWGYLTKKWACFLSFWSTMVKLKKFLGKTT